MKPSFGAVLERLGRRSHKERGNDEKSSIHYLPSRREITGRATIGEAVLRRMKRFHIRRITLSLIHPTRANHQVQFCKLDSKLAAIRDV